jgi:glycosyltransferase involved in cell wall biosynthesis
VVKVSIIVPVYNVEIYLKKCIESILNQTLNEIEIILINDGSTDNSIEVLKKYERKDKRIIIIDKENEGVSKARNDGLKIANGKYIFFVDSDDWIENDCIEIYYKIIENKKSDVACSPILFRVTEGLVKEDNYLSDNFDKDIVKKVSTKSYIENIFTKINGTSVCNKIFRKDIIKDNNIFFRDINKVYSEDGFFNLEYSLKCEKIYCMYKAKYYYLNREDSYTKELKCWKEVIYSSLESIEKIFHKIPKDKKFVIDYYKHFIYINIEENIRRMNKHKHIKEVVKDKFFNELILCVKFNKLTIYQKIRYVFLKYKLIVALLLMNKLIVFLKN